MSEIGLNWVDVFFASSILLTMILGAVRGLFWQIVGLVIFVSAFYLAVYSSPPVCQLLSEKISSSAAARASAFLAMFGVSYCSLVVLSTALERRISESKLGAMDRVLGALLGGAKGVLVCIFVLVGLSFFPPGAISRQLEGSQFAPLLARGMTALALGTPDQYRGQIHDLWEQVRRTDRKPSEDLTHGDTPPSKPAKPSKS